MPLRIQSRWRAYLALQCVRALRQHEKAEFLAVLRIQLAWYRRQGHFATFVLLGCLREQDHAEKELKRRVTRLFRNRNARVVQVAYRIFRRARRRRAALVIQCIWRMYVNVVKVGLMRRRRWAARKLHHWAKGTMRRRHRAARKVAFWWLHAKRGRFLRHLVGLAARLEELELRERQAGLDRAAAAIQAVVHGVWVRRRMRQVTAAIKVQRIARGFLGRRRAAEALRRVRREVSTQYVERLQREALLKEQNRLKRVRRTAAARLQAAGRGFVARLALGRARATMRQQAIVATMLQRAYRGHRRVVQALRELIAQRRRFANPFRDQTALAEVARACLGKARRSFASGDPLAGLGLATALRRLGLDDALPALLGAGVAGLGQLRGLDGAKLEAMGVADTRLVQGRAEPSVFRAAAARAALATLARLASLPPTARAALDESSPDAAFLADFEVIPEDGRASIVQRMFEEAYTNRFASRAGNFADSVARTDLTTHQLRRFFARHSTPATAKEHVGDLTLFDHQRDELARDEKRLLASCDTLRFGAERLRDLVSGHGSLAEVAAATLEGLLWATSFPQVKRLEERRRRWLELNGSKARLQGPDGSDPTVKAVAAAERALERVADLDDAAAFLGNVWRGYSGRSLLAVARHNVAAARWARAYIGERATNHVRLRWEEDRRLEKEEYERSYKEWLVQQGRSEAEARLRAVTRFGWEEVLQEDGGDGEEPARYVFRPLAAKDFSNAVPDRPHYRWDESLATETLQRAQRASAARRLVGRLRRERLRLAADAVSRNAWVALKRERERHVVVRLGFRVTDAASATAELEEDALDDAAFGQRCDGELAKLVDGNAELVVGFPVEARYAGGEAHFPGTVYQVNPTQYTTPAGLKWYPKNTFGVIYDDGDFEPAVPRELIRVMRVGVGTRVEARYGGHPAFFAGTVVGANERDGQVLSYQVAYDDGEAEHAVPRGRIRVESASLLRFQGQWARLQLTRDVETARRRARSHAKAVALAGHARRVEDLLAQFGDAWQAEQRGRPPRLPPSKAHRGPTQTAAQTAAQTALAPPPPAVGTAQAQAASANNGSTNAQRLAALVASARGAFHGARPGATLKLRIDYTRLAMRFGWLELRAENDAAYYFNTTTKDTSWVRPAFDFAEEAAAKAIQSRFRVVKSRLDFRKRIHGESLLKVVAASVGEAAAKAWVGYEEEGLTLDLWLNRMGLSGLVDKVTKAAQRRAQRLNKPAPSDATILEAIRKATSEELKEDFDVARAQDRRLLESLRADTADAAKQLAFINAFSGVGDPRTMRECITSSRTALHAMLSGSFKANPTRVEKMVDALVLSRYPLTRAQTKAFLAQFDGKPAMAQENIGQLVNVPTTHTPAMELASYQVLLSGARRLLVLASNLNVALLKRELEAVVDRSDAVLRGGGDPGGGSGAGGGGGSGKARGKALALVPLTDGHAAKAALLLRVEAFEATRRWVAGTEKVQAAFRAHTARRHWRRFLAARSATCLTVQSLWRGHVARSLASYFREQQRSLWEELWSEQEGVFYYYHKTRGEALWNPPAAPYRPMVRDRFTRQLMQAWPQLENPFDAVVVAEPGMCMRCATEEATRRCHACVPKRPPKWANGQYHFCFVCFAEEHAASAEMRKHTFATTKVAKASDLVCCVCGTLASRRCRGPVVQRRVLKAIDAFVHAAPAANGGGGDDVAARNEAPSMTVFREFVFENKLPFSAERCLVLHLECRGGDGVRSGPNFWLAFVKVLEGLKEECNDAYCARCWVETHRKGRRALHEWVGFAEAASVCVMCEKNVAERRCDACDDDLCTACAVATHLRGKKHRHAMAPIREPVGRGQALCGVCDVRAGDMDCPLCDAPLCDSCLEFNHVECPKKAIVGDPAKPTKCVLCGRPPDSSCVECGEVYCSAKWMGNPGCFVKQHRKGHRQTHSQQKYMYMEEKRAGQKRAKQLRRNAAREVERKQVEAASTVQGRLEDTLRRQAEREARVLNEALRIIEEKKRATKTWMALPSIKTDRPFLAPLRAAMGLTSTGSRPS